MVVIRIPIMGWMTINHKKHVVILATQKMDVKLPMVTWYWQKMGI